MINCIDISAYVDSMLFLIIGFALFVTGGWRLFFIYFKNGLTINEINKVVTVVVGALSMLVGLFALSLIGWNFEVFSGIKVVIALIAIFVIGLELLGGKKC